MDRIRRCSSSTVEGSSPSCGLIGARCQVAKVYTSHGRCTHYGACRGETREPVAHAMRSSRTSCMDASTSLPTPCVPIAHNFSTRARLSCVHHWHVVCSVQHLVLIAGGCPHAALAVASRAVRWFLLATL
ncbi:hypothetical protein F511_24601 [Dorcoceras hygrometricum]|uniref:Uncharacterized protein n=1 Tax=Dorcoceras hygrometricum TaxID=472368 RepID=A0A2Z7CIP6_9LAMI|nr:hypothetical protein F511_24601 [Dorcoceras hygrometricum]